VKIDLVDGYISATCAICGERICLKVIANAPLWELSNPERMLLDPFRCRGRERASAFGHEPEFT
jgi:hypothetical protein